MCHILLEKDNLLEEQTFPHYIMIAGNVRPNLEWNKKKTFSLRQPKALIATKITETHGDPQDKTCAWMLIKHSQMK